MTQHPRWTAPPRPATAAGETRRVGVELEFNGVGVAEAAVLVRELFGGEVRADGEHRRHVVGTALGDFECELDVKFAHRPVDSDLGRRLRDAAAAAAATLLPIEIVCPPVPWDAAHRLEALRAALRAHEAEGTRAAPLYAFGVQLNPELPDLSSETIFRTFQAFLALSAHLRGAIEVDVSRRLWLFEKPFPDDYAAQVLATEAPPATTAFIDGYLRANPTRNRELDLLPLLAHLDEARVRAALPRETIKPRPTWHYRLPNSEIDAPDWRIATEWRRWLMVERLADDAPALARARDAWLQGARGGPGAFDAIADIARSL